MKILSLGLGVQSTALYYMCSNGQLPRLDYAIFADLGKEKKATIQYLKYLQTWQKENDGIPIIVIREKNLYKDLLNSVNSWGDRFSSIPAFTRSADGLRGMLRRQCTSEYKIDQVDKAIRETLNVKVILKTKVEVWKGISLEEIERLSIPQVGWKIHVYPFCNYAVTQKETYKIQGSLKTRTDILKWYVENDLPIPPKSSCVFCPYQSNAAWYEMKTNAPGDFRAAVRIDEAIRDSTKKGIKAQAFLHNSCKPLSEVVFDEGLPDLWHGECSGNCHI